MSIEDETATLTTLDPSQTATTSEAPFVTDLLGQRPQTISTSCTHPCLSLLHFTRSNHNPTYLSVYRNLFSNITHFHG